jgi:hypothetical protein
MKNFVSDRTRQNTRRQFQKRRKVLPGFPWRGMFHSKEEVEAYFANERIQCLLCGKWLGALGSGHLQHIHGISPDEYRERYGLPYSRGLTGQGTHQKLAEHARQALAAGTLSCHGLAVKSTHPARKCPSSMHPRKWKQQHFEAILARMQEQQRTLHNVCQDKDLPGILAWKKFVTQHPEFAERVQQIYAAWPYAIQAQVRRKLSPQFTTDCRRLRAQGLTYQDIADTLGVGRDTVRNSLKKFCSNASSAETNSV